MYQKTDYPTGNKVISDEINWASKYRKGWKKAVQLFMELEAEQQQQQFAAKFSGSCAES